VFDAKFNIPKRFLWKSGQPPTSRSSEKQPYKAKSAFNALEVTEIQLEVENNRPLWR